MRRLTAMIAFLSIFSTFAVFGTAYPTLSKEDRDCLSSYAEPLDNDYLIGTWYRVYQFSLFFNPTPSSSCEKIVFIKANDTEIQRYIAAYNLDNPYSFDDNPVLVSRNYSNFDGMLVGNAQFKFHVYNPASVFYSKEDYETMVYERINDDYMLFHRCANNGFTNGWLMSKKNDASQEELDEIIKHFRPEVRSLDTKRYCA